MVFGGVACGDCACAGGFFVIFRPIIDWPASHYMEFRPKNRLLSTVIIFQCLTGRDIIGRILAVDGVWGGIWRVCWGGLIHPVSGAQGLRRPTMLADGYTRGQGFWVRGCRVG